MSDTGISYLTKTWNPVVGCSPASDECLHCWARALHARRQKALENGKRMPIQYATPFSTIHAFDWRFDEPRHWNQHQRVGVCFGGDLFHADVPEMTIAEVFRTMFKVPRHDYFVLTKRAERMAAVWPRLVETFGTLPQVWAGVTVGNRAGLARLASLRATLAAHRWVSFEPLLEDLGCPDLTGIDWVVVGGETGAYNVARPCAIEWLEAIVAQCEDAKIPVYVKQYGTFVVSEARRADTVHEARDLTGDPNYQYPWLWRAGLTDRIGAAPAQWGDRLVRQLPEVRA